MTPTPVVAAAILNDPIHPTHLLCAARAYPDQLRGQWELPGGKLEDGETPEEALAREIHEEIGCTIELDTPVLTDDGQWWPILDGRRMGVWTAHCAPTSPAPTCGDSHLELRWVPFDEVDTLTWIGHDLPIVHAAIRAARAHAATQRPALGDERTDEHDTP